MGLGGISVWQLVIILIVFLATLIATPVLQAHRSKAGDDASSEAPDEADKPASRDEP